MEIAAGNASNKAAGNEKGRGFSPRPHCYCNFYCNCNFYIDFSFDFELQQQLRTSTATSNFNSNFELQQQLRTSTATSNFNSNFELQQQLLVLQLLLRLRLPLCRKKPTPSHDAA
ncbi:hypothetical protein [Achromobacter sp. UMC46]|uniref:hypothetical protein n=1 Tax=Achromobacter sp. UMC46 TaxID=1862319 RepID=UPI001603B1E2|nr:hypothetical protein [Achromobacter sp. UMC46]